MRKAILTMVLAVGAVAFAEEKKAAKYVDPNPYADYGAAMRSTAEFPFAVNWSHQHNAEIAQATSDAALKAVVADATSAAALLAKVKPAYESDPLVLTQIAAVTQWVMQKDKDGSRAAGRTIWVAALERTIREATDEYVRTFCRQQLQLCK